MVVHSNCLRLLIIFTIVIFFGSVQASQNNNDKPVVNVSTLGYLEWFKKFFYEGHYPTDITISIDDKNESYRRVSDVIITTVFVMGTVKLLWPAIDYIGDEIGGIVEEYLPNVGPIKDFKDQKKKQREQEAIDTIIAQLEREEKVKKFIARTGISDSNDLIKKVLLSEVK